MSGNGAPLYIRFLSRSSMSYVDGLPASSSLTYTTDLRQFSGKFDCSYELTSIEGKKFTVQSHDFAEIYFNLPNGTPFVVGVVFLEHINTETTPSSFHLQANGRDLIGQLIGLVYKVHYHYQGGLYADFVKQSAKNYYLDQYCQFKNQDMISDLGAYRGSILFDTITTKRIGPTLQEYADTVLNLIYQNAQGQIEIYGRQLNSDRSLQTPDRAGTLIKSAGQSNVERLIKTTDYSKVISDYTVFYTNAQNEVDSSNIAAFRNPDSRTNNISQPEYSVLASTDLVLIAGGVNIDARRARVAASEMRKSNQNLNTVTVTTNVPWYMPPGGGINDAIPFEKYQLYHVTSPDDDLDTDMVIAAIHYAQTTDGLEVQLSLVEPDTLI